MQKTSKIYTTKMTQKIRNVDENKMKYFVFLIIVESLSFV